MTYHITNNKAQEERLTYLIEYLLQERPEVHSAYGAGAYVLPAAASERYNLYRSLVNIRPPQPISEEYLQVEDAFLQTRLEATTVVDLDELYASCATAYPNLFLWQGDITHLAVDGIVNAANNQMLGCFVPGHGCIDNAIHTAAGARLRLACSRLMETQSTPEPTGSAKITPGFNLPAAHVIHTVGPIVYDPTPTATNIEQLASCYTACLNLAAQQRLTSLAFCCISTGEFHFPNLDAARIATQTVRQWQNNAIQQGIYVPAVIFNVFKPEDLAIYQRLLGACNE